MEARPGPGTRRRANEPRRATLWVARLGSFALDPESLQRQKVIGSPCMTHGDACTHVVWLRFASIWVMIPSEPLVVEKNWFATWSQPPSDAIVNSCFGCGNFFLVSKATAGSTGR